MTGLRHVLTPCWRFDKCVLFGRRSRRVNAGKRRADAREALTPELRRHHDDRSASTASSSMIALRFRSFSGSACTCVGYPEEVTLPQLPQNRTCGPHIRLFGTSKSAHSPATTTRAMRAGHHGLHRGARRRVVKALRFAPTPFGAGGLDSRGGRAPGGYYVMSLRSTRACSTTPTFPRKEDSSDRTLVDDAEPLGEDPRR